MITLRLRRALVIKARTSRTSAQWAPCDRCVPWSGLGPVGRIWADPSPPDRFDEGGRRDGMAPADAAGMQGLARPSPDLILRCHSPRSPGVNWAIRVSPHSGKIALSADWRASCGVRGACPRVLMWISHWSITDTDTDTDTDCDAVFGRHLGRPWAGQAAA